MPIINVHPLSQPARSVSWFAAYAKSDVEVRTIDLQAGEHKKPDYVAKFPSGQVPTYEEGDFYLEESSAILQYLADGHAIVPKDKKQQAKVQQMIAANMAKVRKVSGEIARPIFFGKPEELPALLKAGMEKVAPTLKAYDTLLAKQSFLAGDDLSIADFLFAPEVDQLLYFQKALGHNVLEAYPSILAYIERLNGVEGYTANFQAACAYLKAAQEKKAAAAAAAAAEAK